MKAMRKKLVLAVVLVLILLPVGVVLSQTQTPANKVADADGLYVGGSLLTDLPVREDEFESRWALNPQVSMEVNYVQFAIADVENLVKRDGEVRLESLKQLWKEEKGKLIGFATVITQPGEEATAKSTIECIYPTEYCIKPASTNGGQGSLAVVPGEFETREIGVILTARPELSPNRAVITVTLSPEMVLEPAWHEYEGKIVTAGGREREVAAKVPFFPRSTITSTLRLYAGETIIAGGANQKPGGGVVFIFLTANLVGCDGKPLSKPAPIPKKGK